MAQYNIVSRIQYAILSYPEHNYNCMNYGFQRICCDITENFILALMVCRNLLRQLQITEV
jgi:hypothetical protein